MNEEGDEEKLLKNMYCPLSMLLILLLGYLSSNVIPNCNYVTVLQLGSPNNGQLVFMLFPGMSYTTNKQSHC